MRKEDFRIGQTVYVHLIGDAARGKKSEECIKEGEVTSVGRKYLTVKEKKCGIWEVKFDINNNFCHVYKTGAADYELFLTKEELDKAMWRRDARNAIRDRIQYSNIVSKLTDDELEIIYGIVKKYE